MKARDRQAWILDYLYERNTINNYYQIDILDSNFVVAFAEHTNALTAVQYFGAPKCPQLGRDLSALYNSGQLLRTAVGIGDGLSSQGFPKWVYSYCTRWTHRL